MAQPTSPEGHRTRLRQQFLSAPDTLSATQLLELLLTYAIARRDVSPLAEALMGRFGRLDGVVGASYRELLTVSGVGEQTALLITLAGRLAQLGAHSLTEQPPAALQQPLFEDAAAPPEAAETLPGHAEPARPRQPQMRTFANDEIANSLTFLPQAAEFASLDSFKAHLREHLPYNSASTRVRRANYILERFFPQDRIDIPLTYYAALCTSLEGLKPVVFYHVLSSELLAAKAAEEVVWPALPLGQVEREALREMVLKYLPELEAASQAKVLRSLFNTYCLLSVASEVGATLRIRTHKGTLESFLYVLTAEFPQPGIYRFEAIEHGPMRRWLLWDRAWMRLQLYNLQDLGIIAKVSEIDTIRQFTLQFDQANALRQFFQNANRQSLAVREALTETETA